MENPPPEEEGLWTRRRWMARLSFSFLILAGCLAYTAYRGGQSHTLTAARISAYYITAGLLVGLALIGARERHR